MTLIYSLSMGGISRNASEFISSGIFGEGWHLFGIGTSEYNTALEEYKTAEAIISEFEKDGTAHSKIIYVKKVNNTSQKLAATREDYEKALNVQRPIPQNYGIWVPGFQTLIPSAFISDKLFPRHNRPCMRRNYQRSRFCAGIYTADADIVFMSFSAGKLRLYVKNCIYHR